MKKTIKLKKTYPVLKKKSLKPFKCLFFKTLIFTATTFKDIPVKIMVSSIQIYSQVLTNIFNNCVKSGNFSNYRPICTLSNFSKVFEKLIYVQIDSLMEPKLSK